MSNFLIFLIVAIPVALSLDSPSPSSPITSPPTTSQSFSPPPPPAESPPPTPSPSPSKTPTPSPSPDSTDPSQAGGLDNNSADGGNSEAMSGRKKAGITFAVILCAVVVVFGCVVYKKRRENICRQRYAYSGRGGIQL